MENLPEDAFLKAFDEYADALFRHAYFRVSERAKAEDLVQDTFMKAWEYLRKGEEIISWKSFLYHVLHNLIVDEYRRKKDVSLDALLEENESSPRLWLTAADSRTEREDRFDDEQLQEHVRELILLLPDRDREVITLRYVDDCSPKEMGAMLGITENAASVRIYRAVERLKHLLRLHHPE